MTDEEEATTTEVQVTDDGRTHEVQEGGDDLVPWVVGLAVPLLLVAMIAAVVASLRR